MADIHTFAFVHGMKCPTCGEDMCMDLAIEMGHDGTFVATTEHKLFCDTCSPGEEVPEITDADVEWDAIVGQDVFEHRVNQIVEAVAEKIENELLRRVIYRSNKRLRLTS